MDKSIKKQLEPKRFKETEINKSKGILEDYDTKKFIATREGTITKVPVNNYDLVNKQYVDGQITLSGGGISNHSGLTELDYASAGHTGFNSSTLFENLSGAFYTLSGANTTAHTNLQNQISSVSGAVINLSGAFWVLSGANGTAHTGFTNDIVSLSGAFYTLSGANASQHTTLTNDISSLSGAFYTLSGANATAHTTFTNSINSLSGAQIIYKSVTAISSNQIKNMVATPVTVVTGIPNKIICPVNAIWSYIYGTTQYTAGGQVNLKDAGETPNIIQTVYTTPQMQAAASSYRVTVAGGAVTRKAGLDIQLVGQTTEYATGDGTGVFTLFYCIADA